jgi:Arc/MetJ-type ribon-helix-helix transcriptional regulator
VIRTQVQLTDKQAAELKQLSATRGRSMSALVRDGVDQLLRSGEPASRAERMRQAASAFGKFRSGRPDLAERHDDHFADAAEHVR